MHSIRWKLLLVSLLIVFIPISFLSHYFISSFDKFTRTVQEENMANQAVALGELYKGICLASGSNDYQRCKEQFSSVMVNSGNSFNSDLMLISPEGTVLFASDNVIKKIGQNLSDKKEVAKAMLGKYGARWNVDKTHSYVFYYIAVPIKDTAGNVIGIAHVTKHTGQITKAIMKIGSTQQKSMIIALLSACLAAIILAYTLTSRLRRLTRASVDYAKGGQLLDNFVVKGKDEVALLGKAVKDMAAEIDKRNHYNREFVSTIMHEVKTPLTAIKGAAEVLSGTAGEKPELRDKFLSNIMIESERLTRMTGELMDLTRIDTEILRVEKTQVDYCDFVRKVLDRLGPTFNSDSTLTVDIPSNKLFVSIIEDRIEQVIANLLDNAMRYSPENGIVSVKVSEYEGCVILTVKDSGPGIPPVNMNRVFNRFFTTEHKGYSQEYGSGIGLAIAKSIVENHHGEIWVESEIGKGTIFGFSLPQG
jgi:signal transduction histidine kinase